MKKLKVDAQPDMAALGAGEANDWNRFWIILPVLQKKCWLLFKTKCWNN